MHPLKSRDSAADSAAWWKNPSDIEVSAVSKRAYVCMYVGII